MLEWIKSLFKQPEETYEQKWNRQYFSIDI